MPMILTVGLSAEVVTEATFGGGYQGNLFNDSNSTEDQYISLDASVKYYPSSSIQFSTGATYSSFTTINDLSNISGAASLTFIPTPVSSSFTLSLGGNVSIRKFGLTYESYDQVGSTFGLGVGYRLTSRTHLQSSAYYYNNSYVNSEFGSNRGIDLTARINFSILGANSITFRLDYSRRSYDQPILDQETGHRSATAREKSSTLR